MGNADRLSDAFAPYLRWVPGLGWMTWTGTHWDRSQPRATNMMCQTIQQIPAELPEDADPDMIERFKRWSLTSQSGGHIKAALETAQSRKSLWADVESFDANPWILNCNNGVLDLTTLEFSPHHPKHMLSAITRADWNPDIPHPKWTHFLHDITGHRQPLIDTLQQCAGYTLSGMVSERCMFMLYGTGRNGKSTFVDALRFTLGSYACYAPRSTFVLKPANSPSNDVASLRGKRLVVASETEEGERLNQGLVKSMTGDHSVTARFLHHEHFEYEPVAKIWMMTNHKPKIRSGEEAIWDRIRLIPFNIRIREDSINPDLFDQLKLEAPGILAWAVEGLTIWRTIGKKIEFSDDVLAATEEYRDEEDITQQFINDCIWFDNEGMILIGDMYDVYKVWCDKSGIRPISRAYLTVHLKAKSMEYTRSKHLRFWNHVRFSPDASSWKVSTKSTLF